MQDYSDHNLTPLDPFRQVEGLVSLSDRVARRKEEQRRRQQRKQRQYENQQNETEKPLDANSGPDVVADDRHIDFRAEQMYMERSSTFEYNLKVQTPLPECESATQITKDTETLTQPKRNQPSPQAEGTQYMKQKVTVLKSDQVRMGGSVCLGLQATPGRVGLAPVKPKASAQADHRPAPQQARILESNDEYAIIEVTCSCGAKSHIQCNYAAMTKA